MGIRGTSTRNYNLRLHKFTAEWTQTRIYHCKHQINQAISGARTTFHQRKCDLWVVELNVHVWIVRSNNHGKPPDFVKLHTRVILSKLQH